MILQPQNSFTIVRQIENHLDTDTNYVRAVIRNAYTDAIIDTLNLTDKGSQRFSKNWQVPADPSGQGFYISIVTSVYTDSGYTSKNPNYGDQENTYLVQDRLARRGGGGTGVDAFTVRKIVQDEIGKVDFSSLTGALGALQREVNRIPKEFPADRSKDVLGALKELRTAVSAIPTDHVDLSQVSAQVAAAIQAIEAKDVTPETDLRPLTDELRSSVDKLATIFLTREDAITEKVVEAIKQDVLTTLKQIVEQTTFSMAPTTMKMNAPEVKKPEGVPFDPNQLAL